MFYACVYERNDGRRGLGGRTTFRGGHLKRAPCFSLQDTPLLLWFCTTWLGTNTGGRAMWHGDVVQYTIGRGVQFVHGPWKFCDSTVASASRDAFLKDTLATARLLTNFTIGCLPWASLGTTGSFVSTEGRAILATLSELIPTTSRATYGFLRAYSIYSSVIYTSALPITKFVTV